MEPALVLIDPSRLMRLICPPLAKAEEESIWLVVMLPLALRVILPPFPTELASSLPAWVLIAAPLVNSILPPVVIVEPVTMSRSAERITSPGIPEIVRERIEPPEVLILPRLLERKILPPFAVAFVPAPVPNEPIPAVVILP